MTTSSTVLCESNTFNLGPWGLGWAHQREESPPPNPSILSDEAAGSCLQSVTQTFLQYASCSLPNLASHLSSMINTPVFASFLACCSAWWSRVWGHPGSLCWKNWHCVQILLNAGDHRFRPESSTFLLQGFNFHWRIQCPVYWLSPGAR